MKKKNNIIIASIVSIAAIIIGIVSCSSSSSTVSLDVVSVKRNTICKTVTATGTIEAIKTVAVGTRVSGEIRKIYVDYNSEVKAGQLLAELDRRPLTTSLTIAEAALENATSEMNYQTANYNRVKALFDKAMIAESEYDQALYTYNKTKASFKTAQLNYDKAKIDLEYAYIYSPIDGVILSRAVDEGQIVAASFSTPTLFSIANDLTRMQVEASIDEADIGLLRNNQRVEFTVDAYPDQKFEGTVTQIRLEPVVTSNVVTYTVVVEAKNPDKKLMPGMTANITIVVEEVVDALSISSKALRFNPDSATLQSYLETQPKSDIPPLSKDMPNHDMPELQGNMPKDRNEAPENMVWIKKGSSIFPVPVEIGLNNDIDVEIKSGLHEGDTVVTAIISDAATTTTTKAATSPFMPKPPTRKTK